MHSRDRYDNASPLTRAYTTFLEKHLSAKAWVDGALWWISHALLLHIPCIMAVYPWLKMVFPWCLQQE